MNAPANGLSLRAERTGETRAAAMVKYLRNIVLRHGVWCEHFHAVFLDDQSRFLSDAGLGMGGQTALSLRMRELFGRALAVNASGLLIAHNHPSGDCKPSAHDIASTHRLIEIGKALDIELVDHLIITQRSVYSMRAGGDL
ncbi:JAB domain-containing protein [Erythrobacter sp. MTPC3]|uniref:JAB domain-containing protein n=1 Tax=Erythrobacter sp. MTPC3 TaxID=3056564 RepID=UPI0036F27E1B